MNKQPKGVRLGGRQKGTPNKFSATLKDMILQALADSGGVEYLKTQAENQPTAFLTLVGRVLPLQVKEGGDDPQVPVSITHNYQTIQK